MAEDQPRRQGQSNAKPVKQLKALNFKYVSPKAYRTAIGNNTYLGKNNSLRDRRNLSALRLSFRRYLIREFL